jgi:16S rRNA (cytosine967-C5)-methyltransferase
VAVRQPSSIVTRLQARPSRGASGVGPAPARACAYAVLRRVFEHGAYADRALHAQAESLDARDRALTMRLVFGTVQRRRTLDHVITALSQRPTRRLDAHVLAALRLGLYEMLFLDGAPDRAVVADAVDLAKGPSRGGHGLVNAVLRRATAEGQAILDALDDVTPDAAGVRYSHPTWLAQLWFDQLGAADARALMACDNEAAELALRVNTLFSDAETVSRALGVPSRTDPLVPEALVVDGRFDAHGTQLWHEGGYMPQSRAAMLVARIVDPQAGERVLDLCAAPGAKTTHLAALMGASGELVAVERHAGRAAALQRTCKRMGAENVRVQVGDAGTAGVAGSGFDRVLVDPPCSGLGTLQARPDLRWQVSEEAIMVMAAGQAAMLAAAADAVRPGGTLVYSTCTISPVENEWQIEAFLRTHAGFRVHDLGEELPEFVSPQNPAFVQTFPHRHRTAGFFIARLRREG